MYTVIACKYLKIDHFKGGVFECMNIDEFESADEKVQSDFAFSLK